jgi:cytochrome c-type biogenesis protein CcmH
VAERWAAGKPWRVAGRRLAALLFALCAATTAWAEPPAAEGPASPELEARVTRLAEELRCLVCQNQSLADSHAPLAVDLKNQVRAQLTQGRSEAEVRDYLVRRYGEFVLYRPPVQFNTWPLWFAPLGLVLAGLLLLGRRWQRTRDLPDDDAGDDDLDAAPSPHPLPDPPVPKKSLP